VPDHPLKRRTLNARTSAATGAGDSQRAGARAPAADRAPQSASPASLNSPDIAPDPPGDGGDMRFDQAPMLPLPPAASTSAGTATVPAHGPRRAAPVPLYLATIASAFWAGMMGAYAIGYFGPAGLLTLPPLSLAGLAVAVFAPLSVIWGFALVIWWGVQMRASADHVAEATRALLAPSPTATAAAASVGATVSQEVQRMDEALKQAEARAVDLRKGLSAELNSLEAASARAEMRARTVRDLVSTERTALIEAGQKLEQESATIVEATRAQVELVSSVTGRAAEQMNEAQGGIVRASDYLSKTLEMISRSAKAVRENVEAQADRLDAAAQDAVTRAGELAGRFADQSEALSQNAHSLAEDNERAVRAFAEQRETLDRLAGDLRARATAIEKTIQTHAGLIDAALDAADAKAMGLGPRVAKEAERLTHAARDAANQVEHTSSVLEARTSELQKHIANATGHLAQAMDFSSKNVDANSERLQTLLGNIGSAAQDAAEDIKAATEAMGAHMERLPEDAGVQADRLRAVMTEQIGAIAAIAESVADALERMSPGPAAGAWPPVDSHREPGPAAGARELQSGPSDQDTSSAPPPWRLGDVISAARAREGRSAHMPRAAHHIIETLQSLSIDLDRALEEEPPLDLWKRYRAGERNVFTRRLASLKNTERHQRIADRYKDNAEFRDDAERYMVQFETLLTNAAQQNPDGLIAETYLSSDIGKVYALLAEATGRVS